MRRVLVATAVAIGALFAGASGASASTYCSLDPTVGAGTPVKYSVTVSTSGLLSSDLYLYGTSSTTTFGGGVGI